MPDGVLYRSLAHQPAGRADQGGFPAYRHAAGLAAGAGLYGDPRSAGNSAGTNRGSLQPAQPDPDMRLTVEHVIYRRCFFAPLVMEIGRAPCRERVWQDVSISVCAVSLKNK